MTQLDLFGAVEAEEARRATQRQFDRTPQTCPCCGKAEPSGTLLENNHGVHADGRAHVRDPRTPGCLVDRAPHQFLDAVGLFQVPCGEPLAGPPLPGPRPPRERYTM